MSEKHIQARMIYNFTHILLQKKLNMKNTKCSRDSKRKETLKWVQPFGKIICHIFYPLMTAYTLNIYPQRQKYLLFIEALSVINT